MADPLAGYSTLTDPNPQAIQGVAELILDDELSVVWGLFLSSTPKDMESITSILLKFFDENNKVVYLMQQAIIKEIQLTSQLNTLFRQNNFASKLLSSYSKRFGLAYIKYILYDIVINVCLNHQDNSDWSCEVDESKLSSDQKHLQQRNLEHLQSVSLQVIQRIVKSVAQFPLPFREMCCHLRAETSNKFPNEAPRSTYAAVGGFVFLRFICPAIVVPHKYGLLEISPNPQILRDLTLLSKVLQTIANGVTFTVKEPYLIPMNDFIQEHQSSVLQFLDELCEPVGIQALEVSQRGRAFSDSRVNLVKHHAKPSQSLTSDDVRVDSDPIPELKRSSLTSSLGVSPPPVCHQYSYKELMGIIQYLTVYWKQMKSHLVQMDNNLGTKHTEYYIKLSVLLEQLGVTSQDVAQQLSEKENKKDKKKRLKLEKKKQKQETKDLRKSMGGQARSPVFGFLSRLSSPK